MALTDAILHKLLRRDGVGKAAVDEVMRRLDVAGGTADASELSYSHTESGLTATTVQAAVDELVDRIQALETTVAAHTAELADHATRIAALETP